MSKIIEIIKEILFCRHKIWKLEREKIILENKLSDPAEVIKKILGRGIEWYDFNLLEKEQDKLNYYLDIQNVLCNGAIKNEIQHFVADMVQEIAISKENDNRDKRLRYSINGIQALWERLKDIQDPRESEPSKENLNDLI